MPTGLANVSEILLQKVLEKNAGSFCAKNQRGSHGSRDGAGLVQEREREQDWEPCTPGSPV